MKRRGFTLIEVVITLTVLGILLSIAMPRFDVLARRLSSTEREISTTLVRAQHMAVARQHDVNLLFDTVAGLLIIHADQNGNGERDPGEMNWTLALAPGVRFVRGSVPAGPPGDSVIALRRRLDDMPVLTFHRSGGASEAGGFYLGTGRSASGEKRSDARAFLIDRGTGQAQRFHMKEDTWHPS